MKYLTGEEIKVGDLVYHSSTQGMQDTKMTVSAFTNNEKMVECRWKNKNDDYYSTQDFYPEELVKC